MKVLKFLGIQSIKMGLNEVKIKLLGEQTKSNDWNLWKCSYNSFDGKETIKFCC